MYQVYFSARTGKPLWHPAVMFEVFRASDAIAVAGALLKALPGKRWGWGPSQRDGIVEVPDQEQLQPQPQPNVGRRTQEKGGYGTGPHPR